MSLKPLDRASLLLRRNQTLGTLMERLAKVNGQRLLVEEADSGLRITYAQASKRVNRWGGGIARRISSGDRVVIATPNGYEMLLLCLAASRAGGIPVPVNPQMRPDEVRHVVDDSSAALIIRTAAEVDGAEPLTEAKPCEAKDVAALFYTSGTTGKPKGVELSHQSLVGQVAIAGAMPAKVIVRGEAVLGLPIAHIMGFVAVLGLACSGIPVYFLPRFRPDEVLDAIEQRHASIFIGVPAMYRMMLEAGAEHRDLSSVRIWGSGADAMPADLAAKFKQLGATASLPIVGAVGEALFFEGYGMVETGGGAAVKASPPMLNLGLGESLGFPLPGYRFRVVDESGDDVATGQIGELLLKGPGVTRGYWGDVAATEATLTDDGWLRTGDLARKGMLGTIVFAGRKKDVIKNGGYSVYALEVERALEEHPNVLEAAVLGIPDDRRGEVPVAVIRLSPGASVQADDLIAWAGERLASYKVPHRIVFADELPRTGTRKVQKRELLSLFD
ncbi:MAG TPA: AMP-binding protein [Acidimicrobiales bacterium]|jgi:long-chain acyl-CoA synthetase|nr:AMP-binding protein [Acidimicrobiales bacterium]